jgi:hypothetical protein
MPSRAGMSPTGRGAVGIRRRPPAAAAAGLLAFEAFPAGAEQLRLSCTPTSRGEDRPGPAR